VPRYAMVTDLRKCVGCEACTIACNAEWGVAPGRARTHVRQAPLTGTFPKLSAGVFVAQCNHCDHPPCVAACPSGATHQGADGIVHIDRNVCIGCGYCVDACPYDARFIDPVSRKADKCDFCAERIARGEAPACVATCTAHAKYFGDLEDPNSEVYRKVYFDGARRIESAAVAVGPNVYYLGRPEHLDLVAASFAPRRPRLPASGTVWERVVKPLVLAAVAATFLGQAIAFFQQLRKGEEDFEG
jgi:Fe-S-cluster-containing dehydrogenase component